AQLIATRPREVVFYLVLDGIKITLPNGSSVLLSNDPTQDLPPERSTENCQTLVRDARGWNRISPGHICSYTKFVSVLRNLIGSGLSAELPEGSNSGTGSAGSTGSSNPPGLPGKLCFDPAVAGINYQKQAAREFTNICGKSQASKGAGGGATKTVSVTTTEKSGTT